MAEIIAVVNQKGGVGKTTTAINIAASLASLGQETLLVDLDPQGNATSGLGFDKKTISPTVYNLLMEEGPVEAAIHPTRLEYLDMICANADLLGAEVEMVAMIGRESRLKQALAKVREIYHFVIVDCPPSLGLLTINAMIASDKVVLPIQCEYYALEGLASFLQTFERVKSALNDQLAIEGVVLTMYDPRISLGQQVRIEIEKFFPATFFKTTIPRNVRLAEAPSFGQPIIQYDPRSRGAEAYLFLARELLERRGLNLVPHNFHHNKGAEALAAAS